MLTGKDVADLGFTETPGRPNCYTHAELSKLLPGLELRYEVYERLWFLYCHGHTRFRPYTASEIKRQVSQWMDAAQAAAKPLDPVLPYHPTSSELAKLENAMSYHPPKVGQEVRYAFNRRKFIELGKLVMSNCPASRELSLAMTKLEEALFWANAAIARNE